MKIALLGYGKMGKVIEQIALERGHEIILKVSSTSKEYDITTADVAIDFSIPSTAFQNISMCLQNNVAVVSGTTGWLDQYKNAVNLCEQHNGAFIYGSNFSVGVNIFFELNTYLAKMMKNLKAYNVSMEEIHHTQKLDAPSGTAITLAEGILQHSEKDKWVLENAKENELEITAKRIENVPGTHSIFYTSDIDTIAITHEAHSRQGFALGAVLAAEWLHGKTGVYSMKDVLNLN